LTKFRRMGPTPGSTSTSSAMASSLPPVGKAILLLSVLIGGMVPLARSQLDQVVRNDVDILMREQRHAQRFGDDLKRAWERFHSGDPKQALEYFQAVLDEDQLPEGDGIQAQYGIGFCHRFMRPFPEEERAIAVFEDLLRQHPESELTPWLLLELGILNRKKSADLEYEPDLSINAESRNYFQRILDEYPDSVVVHEAAIRLSSSYFFEVERRYADKGLELLERHLKRYPDNPMAGVMHMRISIWYFAVHRDFEKSQVHAIRLGQLRLSDPFRWSRNYWHIAQTYRFALDDPEAAAPWFRRIIEEAPKSPHVFLARKILREIERDSPWQKEQGGAR